MEKKLNISEEKRLNDLKNAVMKWHSIIKEEMNKKERYLQKHEKLKKEYEEKIINAEIEYRKLSQKE